MRRHGLVPARRKVDDGQAAMRERDAGANIHPDSLIVRPRWRSASFMAPPHSASLLLSMQTRARIRLFRTYQMSSNEGTRRCYDEASAGNGATERVSSSRSITALMMKMQKPTAVGIATAAIFQRFWYRRHEQQSKAESKSAARQQARRAKTYRKRRDPVPSHRTEFPMQHDDHVVAFRNEASDTANPIPSTPSQRARTSANTVFAIV